MTNTLTSKLEEGTVSSQLPDGSRERAAAPIRSLAVPRDPKVPYRAGSWGVIILVLAVLHWMAFQATDFRPDALVTGARGMFNFLSEAIPPDLSPKVVGAGVAGALTTLWIGLLGTTVSIPSALLLAVLGSRTTSPTPLCIR
ncbi:hypothetical protein [Leucobacter coleopterorum]|uniref:hypothetical protein n=1 Tax=Leucobacter coleopterorum TaxID=2714933 RepID=UPI001FCA5C8F|nr:hypothetical protein [Leucobacter coleopterorum]